MREDFHTSSHLQSCGIKSWCLGFGEYGTARRNRPCTPTAGAWIVLAVGKGATCHPWCGADPPWWQTARGGEWLWASTLGLGIFYENAINEKAFCSHPQCSVKSQPDVFKIYPKVFLKNPACLFKTFFFSFTIIYMENNMCSLEIFGGQRNQSPALFLCP